MTQNEFFDEAKDQSKVKIEIVTKYFWAWAKVIIPWAKTRGNKIGYIDLFAGLGLYADGTKSTPLLILEQVVQDKDMCNMLVTVFNDVKTIYIQNLEKAANLISGIERLKYKPQFSNIEVGNELVKMLGGMQLIPSLIFIDPWGYKGLSLQLINSAIKNWGCDCIIFFNYNRINMGLNNPTFRENMDAIFGPGKAEELRKQLEPLDPDERELTIIEAITQAFFEMGGKYVLPFRFKDAFGNKTSHHLIFITKNVLGYSIMKDIMAKGSSEAVQGVPSFEYNPATVKQPLLFELSRPLDELGEMLLLEFAGRTMRMVEIFERHNIGKPFISKNYKDILIQLEAQGKIIADPPVSKRKKIKGKTTFSDNVVVTFPSTTK